MKELLQLLALLAALHVAIGTALLAWFMVTDEDFTYWRQLSPWQMAEYWLLFAFGWGWALVKTARGDDPEVY